MNWTFARAMGVKDSDLMSDVRWAMCDVRIAGLDSLTSHIEHRTSNIPPDSIAAARPAP
jgi:hypothetical protein